MINADIKWTKENVWNFVKYNTFMKTKAQKIVLISYFVCFLVILTAGILSFCITQELTMLLISGAALILLVAYLFIFVFMMKNMAKKILAANQDDTQSSVQLDEEQIVVYNSGTPVGKIDWEKIGEIDVTKSAAYVMTKENALMLLEYSFITEGTKDELVELLVKKNAELSKKA